MTNGSSGGIRIHTLRILNPLPLPIGVLSHIYLKPTSYLIAISSISSWMMSFCPYITFTIVSLCQWNTIASYGKCLLVIRRCLKLYPVSMPVRCDIDLTVIFKSCRALYCLSIPIPFIMPNRLTGAPYLASRSFARLRPAFMLISFALRTFPNMLECYPILDAHFQPLEHSHSRPYLA